MAEELRDALLSLRRHPDGLRLSIVEDGEERLYRLTPERKVLWLELLVEEACQTIRALSKNRRKE